MIKSNVSKTALTKLLSITGIIILLVSAISYWQVVYNSPARVFDRMLMTSLSTPSVTKTITQSDDSQKLRQTVVLLTESEPLVHSISVLSQTTDSSTNVTTESIATPFTDYVRYTNIQTSQKNTEGKAFDFKDVLGVWGQTDQNDPSGSGAQLFNQTLLGVVPFANISKPQRDQLLEQIRSKGVYSIDTSNVKRQRVNGRPVYSYEVTVKPVAYVTLLKAFAQANGLKQLDEVDPEQYAESQPLTFTFDIDVWSGQLVKIIYSNSERTEAYSAYGAKVPIVTPPSAIPVNELQSRLQKIR